MNKIVKSLPAFLNFLLGLFVIYDFLALIFFPGRIIELLLNYFTFVLILGVILTIVSYVLGTRENKKINKQKLIEGLLASVPVFLVLLPLLLLVVIFIIGKVTHSQAVSSLPSLLFPSYYISLFVLPQSVLLGFVLPAKFKTAISNFFTRFIRVIAILVILTNIVGFGFLVSISTFPTLAANNYFSMLALPIFFLDLVFALVVVLVRLKSLPKNSAGDYLPFLTLIIVILGFVFPELLGSYSISTFAYVFYLMPTVAILLNYIPSKWNISVSKKSKKNSKKK